MKGKVIKSFAGRDAQGNRVSYGQGDVIEIPPGVDWVKAGLIEPIQAKGKPAAKRRKKATVETAETRHAKKTNHN